MCCCRPPQKMGDYLSRKFIHGARVSSFNEIFASLSDPFPLINIALFQCRSPFYLMSRVMEGEIPVLVDSACRIPSLTKHLSSAQLGTKATLRWWRVRNAFSILSRRDFHHVCFRAICSSIWRVRSRRVKLEGVSKKRAQ
jgi:hypothetical protein